MIKPTRVLWKVIVWLGCSAYIFSVSDATAANPTYTQIVNQFEAISFSTEYGGEERRGFFFRWPNDRPVYYRTLGDTHPGLEPVLEELRELTGLRFERTPPRDRDRIVIQYRPQRDCWTRGNGNLISVTIATAATQTIRHCHLEELIQSVGPSDDACLYRPTIFCDGDNFLQDYTPADRIIIRTTFDPRLPDFGEKVYVMPIARQIIRELYEEQYGLVRDEDRERDAEGTDALSLP